MADAQSCVHEKFRLATHRPALLCLGRGKAVLPVVTRARLSRFDRH